MSDEKNEYRAEDIKVLTGLEAIRRRPGMYVGDLDDGSGLHNLAFALAERSIEERETRACGEIAVTLNADGSMVFEDDGAGLPAELDPREGLPMAELILTRFLAGGRDCLPFPVVNALSSRLELNTWSEGFEYAASFADGVTTSPFRKVSKNGRAAGLRITFWPSPEIFSKTEFDYAVLRDRLRDLAALHPGVRIVLTELRKSDPYCEEMIYERRT